MACVNCFFFEVQNNLRKLPSLVSTYVLIWQAILAHMAQWSSAHFIVNAIMTATGGMFESVKKQIFFALH